jgi:hypothetical protein
MKWLKWFLQLVADWCKGPPDGPDKFTREKADGVAGEVDR